MLLPFLQTFSYFQAQAFLLIDKALCNILNAFLRRFIFIQIAIQRLHSHIATVSHQISYGIVRAIHDQLDICFYP